VPDDANPDRKGLMRAMTTKRVLFGSLGLLILLAVVLGSQAGASNRKVSANTITYWSRGANEAINKTLVAAWNSSHAQQVQLLAVPDAEYETKLAAAIAAGTPPDVATVDVAVVPKLIQGGALQNITSKAKALPYYGKLAKGFINYATVGGQLYAVPVDIDASALFYNKDLFRRAHIKHPPKELRGDPGRRQEDHRARPWHQGLVHGGWLRRLQRLHVPSARLGERWRLRDQGR